MSQFTAISKNKFAGGALLGAVASSLAAGAGTAHATCASISGIGNGGGCTSTPTSFAIGIGPNTTASAQGLFTGAIAIGPAIGFGTAATSTGALSLSLANGQGAKATTQGNLALAVAVGDNLHANAGATPADNLNVAVNIVQGELAGKVLANSVDATGQGNFAANIGGLSDPAAARVNQVRAVGVGNAAFNLGGKGNDVFAGDFGKASTLGVAFNVLGNDNAVRAFGPLAVAGVIGQDGKNVLQDGPGINLG